MGLSNQSTLTLTLSGNPESIDAGTISTAIDLLVKLVKSFSRLGELVQIGKLSNDGLTAGVLISPKVEEEILNGICVLRNSSELPANWTVQQMQYINELSELQRNAGVEGVYFTPSNSPTNIPIDGELVQSIEKALRSIPFSYGSVIGELFEYRASGEALQAKLLDRKTKEVVTVEFDESLDNAIRNLLRHQVVVYGLLQRYPDTGKVKIVRTKKIQEMPEPTKKVSGRGIWSDLQVEGMDSVAVVRSMREETYPDSA